MKALKRYFKGLRALISIIGLALFAPVMLFTYCHEAELNLFDHLTPASCIYTDGKLELDLNTDGNAPVLSSDMAVSLPPRKRNVSREELDGLLSQPGYTTLCFREMESGKLHAGSVYDVYIVVIIGVLIGLPILISLAPSYWRYAIRTLRCEETPSLSAELWRKAPFLVVYSALFISLLGPAVDIFSDVKSKAWVPAKCSVVAERGSEDHLMVVYDRKAGNKTYRSSLLNGIENAPGNSSLTVADIPDDGTPIDCQYNPKLPSQMKLAAARPDYWFAVKAVIIAFAVFWVLQHLVDYLESKITGIIKARALKANGKATEDK